MAASQQMPDFKAPALIAAAAAMATAAAFSPLNALAISGGGGKIRPARDVTLSVQRTKTALYLIDDSIRYLELLRLAALHPLPLAICCASWSRFWFSEIRSDYIF